MAVVAVLAQPIAARRHRTLLLRCASLLGGLLLILAILLVHGYHPHADDAALYIAGIEHLSNAALYSSIDIPYLAVQAGSSLFEPLLAAAVSLSRGHVDLVLFLAYLLTSALFLLGVYRLASLLFARKTPVWFACLLAAAAYTLPVAGTSLAIMDPYLTARSFSTPFSLFAIEAVLRGRNKLALALAALTFLFHPLMGLCLLFFLAVLFLFCSVPAPRRKLPLLLLIAALSAAFVGADATASLHPSTALYRHVVLTRSYLFLVDWKWYEYIGLLAPVLIAAYVSIQPTTRPLVRATASAIVITGTALTVLCTLFVGPWQSLFLARMQAMRTFHPIYLMGVVLLGGWLGTLYARGFRATLIFPAVVAASLFAAQLFVYQGAVHLQFPGQLEPNPWHQGFLWVDHNTPAHAVFAADPHMIGIAQEGHEGFRATAERSILADDKDGGVATLSPALAAVWTAQYEAQSNLAAESDTARIARLTPFGVTWLLLPPSAATGFACPYRNRVLKVCRLGTLPAPQGD